MTSGTFATIPIALIEIKRDDRQRKELKGIDELASSISKIGLIHAPVISRSNVLIAGERRLTAMKLLGWESCPVQYADTVDDEELHLIELEENIKRVDLTWQDEVLAMSHYHKIRSAEPDWTMTNTAEALGVSKTEVSTKIGVAKRIEAGDNDVATAQKFSVARGLVLRGNERRQTAEMNELHLTKYAPAVQSEEQATVFSDIPLINEDFIQWSLSYTGPKFDFVHCDFPYGINANKHDQSASTAMGGYADSPEVYWTLLETLCQCPHLHESCHLMFWFSMDYYRETLKILTDVGGFTVNPFPLIWHKTDNAGVLPDPNRGPRRIYETAFICHRGDRKVVRAVGNAFGTSTTKLIHMSEKPKPMLEHFFRMFVDEHTSMLDPTCGSGNSVRTASDMGAKLVLGIERDEDFYTRSCNAWLEADING